MIETLLVDARNIDDMLPAIKFAVATAPLVGIDTEFHDANRHEGLNQFCGYKDGKKGGNRPLVFDMQRTVMTGFSIYPDGASQAYYVNLNHADTENRVPWEKAKQILDAKAGCWVAHNAPVELTVFKSLYGYDLGDIICSLQLAVSCHGPDEYDVTEFMAADQGALAKWVDPFFAIADEFDPNDPHEIVFKVTAKESDAEHSYNGYADRIAYGYSLKDLAQSLFGHKMTRFEEVLRGRLHMGELTGPETAAYGAEDAYWCVRVFHALWPRLPCPETFLNQENAMVPVYASIWQNGMRVNLDAVLERREVERSNMAAVLRRLKASVNDLLPFPTEPHPMRDEWYQKGYAKYRKQIVDWAKSPDSADNYTQVQQVRGPVSNAWGCDSKGPNLSHYMPIRVLMYDLLQEKTIVLEGKTQSDGEARGKLRDRVACDSKKLAVLDCLAEIAGIEQRMKLYLTPYSQLTDPETNRMYPVVTSMLATRRMAASFPNPMQLAKRGESTYVRGFYEPDYDDHLIVSIDWSAIELVIIGELSQDPEFIKAFGQLPHADLHAGAAADILAVDVPGLNEKHFKALKDISTYDGPRNERLFTNLKGEVLSPESAYKYWRTEVGKGANFNYWYSGWLGTIGERMGWSPEKTKLATEKYRERFSVAEAWRTGLIDQGHRDGFVTLPDGHRRVRFEATSAWYDAFLDKFIVQDCPNYNAVWRWVAQKIAKRAGNQLVNAMVQGTCSTIAKRSILRINAELKARHWDHRIARFLLPIHDELLFSVHRSYVVPFVNMARGIMITHPDLFKACVLDASPAVGVTFEPWHPTKAPLGQIELFEAPKLEIIPEQKFGKKLSDDEVAGVVDYLSTMRRAA